MKEKIVVKMPVAVHPMQAKLWQAMENKKITPEDPLRTVAEVIGVPTTHPQTIKHHLDQLVKLGAVDFENGRYKW